MSIRVNDSLENVINCTVFCGCSKTGDREIPEILLFYLPECCDTNITMGINYKSL